MNHVVIMAGGVGSRLWPLSTPELPKQFIDILGKGKTLIQLTAERFEGICPRENIWVVTGEKYVPLVREQLPYVPEQQILAEPQGRNTAPCIAYASWKIALKDPGANIVVTPSDAIVSMVSPFAGAIEKALSFTAGSDSIVTIGTQPTRPETGYGYIQASGNASGSIVKVLSFKEKPSLEVAGQYLAAGGYYWNAGIFVWNVNTIIGEIRAHAPQIASVMDSLAPHIYKVEEQEALRRLFPQCEKISIDYAVMERSSKIYVIGGEYGWSDLGSWSSVKEHMEKDMDGNAVVGTSVKLHDCHDCIVHVAGDSPVEVEGLDGYIVAGKAGRLLICNLKNTSKIFGK